MEVWDWSNCTAVFGLCINATESSSRSYNLTEDLSASVTFRELTRFWITRVLVPCVVTLGVLSNFVTMVVLTRRRMRSSTNMYLTALAASDLLYLLFMFTVSLQHYPYIHDTRFYYYWQYWRFGIWLTDATSYTSIWLTVSFTVERYIAVCHPMKGKVLCTEGRARVVILTVYFLCFLVTSSTAFEWQTIANLTPKDNATVVYLGVTSTTLGDNDTYVTFFYWFSCVTFVFLPLMLLAVFNCFLVHAVHRSQRQRCKMTQSDQTDHAQSQENRITIILIAVVILFIVCQSPSAITLIYKSFYTTKTGSAGDNVLRGLGNIFNFLVAINASCNFLLYCALSDKYRRTFLITFLSCWHRPSSHMHSLYHNNSMYSNSSRHQSTRDPSRKHKNSNQNHNIVLATNTGLQMQRNPQNNHPYLFNDSVQETQEMKPE